MSHRVDSTGARPRRSALNLLRRGRAATGLPAKATASLVAMLLGVSAAQAVGPGEVVGAAPLDGLVLGVDPVSGFARTLGSGGSLSMPSGVAIDGSGHVLVADSTADALIRIDAAGVQSVVSQGGLLAGASSLTIESSGQVLVGAPAGLVRVDPTTGAQTLLTPSSSTFRPSCLVVEASGSIVATDDGIDGFGGIHRVDPVSGASTLFSTVSDSGICVAIEASGSLVVTRVASGEVVRVDPASGVGQTLSAGGLLDSPYGVAVDDAGSVIIANRASLLRIDPVTAVQTQLWSGANLLIRIAVAPGAPSPDPPAIPATSPLAVLVLILLLAGCGAAWSLR